MKCTLCDSTILGHGNNAQPISNGRCCDSCNINVIMERAKRMLDQSSVPDTPDIKTIKERNRENWIT